MSKRQASLSDKFELGEARQLLSGTQAIVRLCLMQRARDRTSGLDTAGYVSGYRGSPIATIEQAFHLAGDIPAQNGILFQPAINEDLAATAIWGTQQAELRGDGKHDGVFAIWYGKGPGVDRSGDAFRHANHAGTSRHGGVVALMGDDHTCESSTSAHQSEFAFLDAMIPILNPSGVQEILDYGLYGFALSRFAGVWVGLKCVKDNVESTATVDGRLDRVTIRIPDETAFKMPPGGLNIRLGDSALAKEARLHEHKRDAILAFNRANGLDRIVFDGGPSPRIGIVTAGKSYLDTRQALDELGIDEARATALGLRLYKVAMSWPLEPEGIARFVDGLDLVLVIEEKRSLIESQFKEELYDVPVRPRVLGKKDEAGRWLFPVKAALDPLDIAASIGDRIMRMGGDAALAKALAEINARRASKPTEPEALTRIPYFCAGCPHNSSTVVPDGSRAYAGIGCHYMAQWMDRETDGFTQMGGEGANWVGEAPFSNRRHVFQNIGDGTYVHSGSLAIRAAVAAGTTMTFKLLYNDAVAMTGGQPLEGGMTVGQMAAQLVAEGVARLDVVTDEPSKYPSHTFPAGVRVHHRRDLEMVQRTLAATDGVTVLLFDQTCAAEKRRRRKRGTMPEAPARAFINPMVCEGCGDCGRVSNCVAVTPLETPFGRKREIDQSACNKDMSCVEGFCPSFVMLEGAQVKRGAAAIRSIGDEKPPSPQEEWERGGANAGSRSPRGEGWGEGGLGSEGRPASEGGHTGLPASPQNSPPLDRPYAILVTGVGGTGVVTVSAVLAQAAHIAGLGFGSIDVTGLAQKGGAVVCHMRIARHPDDVHAIRVGIAHADLVIGGDLVVTASNKILEAIDTGHTAVVYSTHEMTTGAFTRDPDLGVPGIRLANAIAARTGDGDLSALDAHDLAIRTFGDSLYANMILLGVAVERGHVPIPSAAIEEAIALNGTAVANNVTAFRLGRQAASGATGPRLAIAPAPASAPPAASGLAAIVDLRATYLAGYQDEALAGRYRSRIDALAARERAAAPGLHGVAEAAAHSYFKLLSYKDEYEVARLYTDGRFEAMLADKFDRVRRISFHLAPPLLARRDPATGHPRKMRFGPWMLPVLRMLAKGKRLRGTRWDPFALTAERREERRLIADFEALLDEIAARLTPANHAAAVALASVPQSIRGFGHVKKASIDAARRREADLRRDFGRGPAPIPDRAAAE